MASGHEVVVVDSFANAKPSVVGRLEALTGQRKMDATAILDYFAPLKKWLDQQNKGVKAGW